MLSLVLPEQICCHGAMPTCPTPPPGTLTGEITLDSLNPPHGKISGMVELPVTSGAAGFKFSQAKDGWKIPANGMAVCTYSYNETVVTVHICNGDEIPTTKVFGACTYTFHSGVFIAWG